MLLDCSAGMTPFASLPPPTPASPPSLLSALHVLCPGLAGPISPGLPMVLTLPQDLAVTCFSFQEQSCPLPKLLMIRSVSLAQIFLLSPKPILVGVSYRLLYIGVPQAPGTRHVPNTSSPTSSSFAPVFPIHPHIHTGNQHHPKPHPL